MTYDRCDYCGKKPAFVMSDGLVLCRDCEAKHIDVATETLHGTRL